MNKNEYISQVLAQMPDLLKQEKKAVAEELSAHFEDRMEPLLALQGVDEGEAERRCAAAMGDPTEVGKELAKQHQSFFWVILHDIVTGVLALFLIFSFVAVSAATDLPASITARIDPTRGDREDVCLHAVDHRMKVGNDIIRVYEAQVQDGVCTAYVVTYDRLPGGVVALVLKDALWLENQHGNRAAAEYMVPWGGEYAADYYRLSIPVETEDTCVVLTSDLYGEYTRLTIPLAEVTV